MTTTAEKIRADIADLITTVLTGTDPAPVVYGYEFQGLDLERLEVGFTSPDNSNFVNVWTLGFKGFLQRKRSREVGSDRGIRYELEHYYSFNPTSENLTQFEADTLAVAKVLFEHRWKDPNQRPIAINSGQNVEFVCSIEPINGAIVRKAVAQLIFDTPTL